MKNILFILFLTLIFSNVFFVDVNNSLIGDGFDNYEYFGFMNLARENMLAFKHPFAATNTLRYPDGFDFSYGFDGAFAVLAGAMLSIFLSPIFSYNLTIVLILFLNIYLSYHYFKKFGQLYHQAGDLSLKALLAALIFGVSPYVFARINGHLNLAFIGGVPMLVYYFANLNKNIVQSEQGTKIKDLVWMLAAVILISMGSLQYLVLLLFVLPIALLLIVRKEDLPKYKEFIKKYKRQIINAFSIFLVIFTFLFHGYIRALLSGDLILADARQKFFAPHVMDVFVPNRYLGDLWALINPSPQAIERVITVGTLELGILVYLLMKIRDKKVQLLGLSLFLLYLFLSFGIWSIPYYPEGGRVVILLSLFMALALVTQDHLFTKPVYTSLLLTVVIIERLFFHVQISKPLAAGEMRREVSPLSGQAVLNIPLSKYSSYRSALPVFYEKKILDGYFHYTAATAASEKTLDEKHFSRLVCQFERRDVPETGFSPGDRREAMDAFKAKDIGSIVVFKDEEVGKLYYDDCANVRDWWFYLNPETVVLSTSTPGVVKNNFELDNFNPHTIARFYFARGGKFYLNGLLVTPGTYDDVKVYLPSGQVIEPAWQQQAGNLSSQFAPSVEIDARAGDELMIMSDKMSEESRYINAYYVFQADRTSPDLKSIPIELVYSDSNVDVYKLN